MGGPHGATDLLYTPSLPLHPKILHNKLHIPLCFNVHPRNLTYYVYTIASVSLEGMTDTRSPALTLSAAAHTCYGAHCLRAQREVCRS